MTSIFLYTWRSICDWWPAFWNLFFYLRDSAYCGRQKTCLGGNVLLNIFLKLECLWVQRDGWNTTWSVMSIHFCYCVMAGSYTGIPVFYLLVTSYPIPCNIKLLLRWTVLSITIYLKKNSVLVLECSEGVLMMCTSKSWSLWLSWFWL